MDFRSSGKKDGDDDFKNFKLTVRADGAKKATGEKLTLMCLQNELVFLGGGIGMTTMSGKIFPCGEINIWAALFFLESGPTPYEGLFVLPLQWLICSNK